MTAKLYFCVPSPLKKLVLALQSLKMSWFYFTFCSWSYKTTNNVSGWRNFSPATAKYVSGKRPLQSQNRGSCSKAAKPEKFTICIKFVAFMDVRVRDNLKDSVNIRRILYDTYQGRCLVSYLETVEQTTSVVWYPMQSHLSPSDLLLYPQVIPNYTCHPSFPARLICDGGLCSADYFHPETKEIPKGRSVN